MAHLMTDEEARRAFKKNRPTELWGVPIPPHAWVGPGALDEFADGKGDDDDR